MLRINIDGNSFDGSVDGLPELEERIFRSDELKGFLTEITGSITLHGEAYEYLRTQFKNNLFSRSKVQLDTQDETTGVWTRIFNGEIKGENVRFDLIKKEADAELTDNGFFGLIDANRETTANLNVNTSYNGQVIDPAPLTDFSTFNLTNHISTNNSYTGGPTGTITIPPAKGYYTWDALRFLVDFMTNSGVGFRSDFFDYNNINNFFAFSALFSGRQLHLLQDNELRISWEDLFTDLHRLFNVWFTIEDDGSGPIMRVEPYDYFVRTGVQQVFEAVTLVETLDRKKMFNRIDVGCSREDRGFVPKDSYRFHWRETFNTLSDVKEDTTLDLTLKTLIINSNSIKRVLPVQLRGGHEINSFVLARGLQIGTPTPFELEDSGGRPWRTSNVDGSGFLAVNYTSNLASATGAVAGAIIDTEQNIFFGTDVYHVFDTDDELFDDVFFITFVNTLAPAVAESRSVIAAPPVSVGGPDVRAYNPDINNISVINNHLANFPSSVFQVAGQSIPFFNVGITWMANISNRINLQLAPSPISPIGNLTGFSNPAYFWLHKIILWPEDTQLPTSNSGEYNPATGRFTCPAGNGGLYSFLAVINVLTSGFPGVMAAAIQHYDSAGTLIQEFYNNSNTSATFNIVNNRTIKIIADINLQPGDFVVTAIGKPTDLTLFFFNPEVQDTPSSEGTFAINNVSRWAVRSNFRLLSTPDTTGVVAVPDTNQVEVVLNDVEGYISPDDWNAIKAQPYTALQVRFGENKSITGRIVEVTRNLSTGESTATLQRPFDNVSNLLNE